MRPNPVSPPPAQCFRAAAARWSPPLVVLAAFAMLAGCLPDGPPPSKSTQDGVLALLTSADDDPDQRDALIAAGARSFRAMACVTCHAMDATPMTGPRLNRLYENPVQLAKTTDPDGTVQDHPQGLWIDRDRPYLWRAIAKPQAEIVQGFTGAQRMTYFAHLMDDQEVAGLIAYLESNTRREPSPSGKSTETPFQ